MILTDDDDDDCLNIINRKTTCEIISNENGVNCFIPVKQTICTFFKPKNLTNNTKQNGGIFEKVKQSICCDIDSEYYEYKFPKTQTDSCQISSTDSNPTKLDIIKQESFIKCEKDLQRSFSSTASSSLSNLPTISAAYSKSTKSLSDSDNQDQLDNPINSLIVKDVYSLCKKVKPSNSTRKKKNASKSMPLNTCIESCDNSITIVRKSVPAIKKLTKTKTSKSKSKSKTKSSKTINNKTAEETLQRINDVFKLIKQQTETKSNLIDISDTQSQCSDALTEAMREDINDFDLEPVNKHQSNYNLMQPIILLEPLRFDKVSRLKRQNSDNNCRDSLEPLKKKLKLNHSLVSSDSTEIITHDKFSIEKIDDGTITTEKTPLSSDSLLNNRNNSRNKVIYHSMTDFVENDIIYCFVCKKYSKTVCKFHPVTWIPNENINCPYVEYLINETFERYFNNHSEKVLCTCNRNELDHIQISLPKIFHLKESSNSEIGVWTKQKIKQGSIIGPYLGDIVENWKSKKSIGCPYKTRRLLKSGNYDELHCLEFAFKSNWLRCINFTNEDALANLKILRYDGKIFFQSTRDITENTELLVMNNGSDFEVFKIKMRSDKLNSSVPDLIDRKNLVASGKIFCSSQDKLLNSDLVKNVLCEGQKNKNNEIIEGMGKILKKNPQKTVLETVTTHESQCRKEKVIKVKKFSAMFSRLQSRYRDIFLSKIDKDIIDHVSESLMRNPLLTSSQINKRFCEKFPHKPQMSILRIKQIITLFNLRTLQGINDNIELEIVREIVEVFTFNRHLTLEEVQKHLSFQFPKKSKLSIESIDKIVKLNHCRISEEQDIYRVDHDVLKAIKVIINAGNKLKEIIYEKVKQKYPEKEIITLQYIGYLIKKYNLSKKHSLLLKCDQEMTLTIYKLYLDHPEYSAPKINEQLRNLLPNKPLVSRRTISKKIQQFRFGNK